MNKIATFLCGVVNIVFLILLLDIRHHPTERSKILRYADIVSSFLMFVVGIDYLVTTDITILMVIEFLLFYFLSFVMITLTGLSMIETVKKEHYIISILISCIISFCILAFSLKYKLPIQYLSISKYEFNLFIINICIILLPTFGVLLVFATKLITRYKIRLGVYIALTRIIVYGIGILFCSLDNPLAYDIGYTLAIISNTVGIIGVFTLNDSKHKKRNSTNYTKPDLHRNLFLLNDIS